MKIITKKDISTTLRALSPMLHELVRNCYIAVCNALSSAGRAVVRGSRKLCAYVALKFKTFIALPLIVKLYVLLLTLLPLFALWQFFAYQLPQATFTTVNILVALILAVSMLRISVFSHKRMEEMKEINDETQAQLDRRDAELAKLKSDIFELRNKARRGNATKKSAVRFVELAKAQKQEAEPSEEKYQYLVTAISKLFDVSGVVAYARRSQDSDEFDIAGRYALADDPPTTVVVSGEGILGQAIASNKVLTLPDVPKDYLTAVSGLGKSRALNLYALPLVSAGSDAVVGVVEVACFAKLPLAAEWESVEKELSEII